MEYDYRLVYAAEVNTYWSIVDQSYVHHCTEDAVLDTVLAVKGADLAKEAVVKLLPLGRRSRLVEIGLVSLLRGREESELRDWMGRRSRVSIGRWGEKKTLSINGRHHDGWHDVR